MPQHQASHSVELNIDVKTSDDSSVPVTNDDHQDLSASPDLLKDELQLLVERNEDDLTVTNSFFLYTCVRLGQLFHIVIVWFTSVHNCREC